MKALLSGTMILSCVLLGADCVCVCVCVAGGGGGGRGVLGRHGISKIPSATDQAC